MQFRYPGHHSLRHLRTSLQVKIVGKGITRYRVGLANPSPHSWHPSQVSPYRAVLELPLSIADPGDNILGIVSNLDIDVVELLFAAFDVSIIVEQSEIRWNAPHNKNIYFDPDRQY